MGVSFHKQIAPLLFGAGAVAQLHDRIAPWGVKKALIVTDKGVIASGAVDKVTASLTANGFDFAIFDGCLPDAPEQSFFGAADMAREIGADIIIAVGGGSNMDTSKAASTMIKNRPQMSDLLPPGFGDENAPPPPPPEGPPPFKTPDVKLVLVPTTSGTGSEETFVAVISDSTTHSKFGVLITGADLSIVDPELAAGMPPGLTASTGMDTVSHACEAFTTMFLKNPMSDQRALCAMRLAKKWLPVAVKDGANIEARTNMSLACTLAGMAFNDSMNNFGHDIAHVFGKKKQMAHGLGCALAEPPALEAIALAHPDVVREIGEQFDAKFPDNATPEQIGKATGDALRALMKEIGIPSLEKVGISREEALSFRDAVIKETKMGFTPIEVTPEVAEKVLASMYDDYK